MANDLYTTITILTRIANDTDDIRELMMSSPAELNRDAIFEEISTHENELHDTIEMLTNLAQYITHVAQKTHNDINAILDHELEVFDPLVDGPVEHSEGMAQTQSLINDYFNTITEHTIK